MRICIEIFLILLFKAYLSSILAFYQLWYSSLYYKKKTLTGFISIVVLENDVSVSLFSCIYDSFCSQYS